MNVGNAKEILACFFTLGQRATLLYKIVLTFLSVKCFCTLYLDRIYDRWGIKLDFFLAQGCHFGSFATVPAALLKLYKVF
jgi:hypothetical protein